MANAGAKTLSQIIGNGPSTKVTQRNRLMIAYARQWARYFRCRRLSSSPIMIPSQLGGGPGGPADFGGGPGGAPGGPEGGPEGGPVGGAENALAGGAD